MGAGDLAYVRLQAEEALPDICDIEQRTLTTDTVGGFTETWAIAWQDIPCRFADRTGRERALASREVVEGEWVLTLPHDQEIEPSMRVRRGGDIYEVTWVNEGRSYMTAKRALLKRVV